MKNQLRLVVGLFTCVALVGVYQNCGDSGLLDPSSNSSQSASPSGSGSDTNTSTTTTPNLPMLGASASPSPSPAGSSNPQGGTGGTPAVNATTPIAKFMVAIYKAALKRDIGQSEVDSWSKTYAGGSSCPVIARAVLNSPEAQKQYPADASGFITYVYQALLGRAPDSGGMSSFSSYLSANQNSATARALVRDSIAASDELQAHCQQLGLNMDDGVSREAHQLFINGLHRGLAESDVAFFEGVYKQAPGPSCVRLIGAVAQSQEATSLTANFDAGTYVNWLFATILNRGADSAGATFWTNEVKAKGKAAALQEMIDGGKTADSELYERCKGLGMVPNT